MILSTLPPWLKGIINTGIAEATQHTRTTPTLKELWDFLEHSFHEYDPSRADEQWRALTPRMVRGQVSLFDLEEFYTRWQRLLPLTNDTGPNAIREQLLSKIPLIKEEVVKKGGQEQPGQLCGGFYALDPSPGHAPFEKELKKYSAQRCTTVPEIVSYSGPRVIADCKDPYLQEWILQLNNTPHTKGYTMKVQQRRPRLKPEDIYALAHKDVSERGALDRLNRGDKTAVTYTHHPSPQKTAVNAVNADDTADLNTAQPTDTSVNAVGHPEARRRKPATPGLNRHLRIHPFGFHVPNIQNKVNKRIWTNVLIGVSPITHFGGCKPNSPCNDSLWAVCGKSRGRKPKGGGTDKGGGGSKGGVGDEGGGGGKGNQGGKGGRYGSGRW